MVIPIRVPSFGVHEEPIRVGTWLVEVGQSVEQGDRIVELELTGMVYIVSAESSGTMEAIEQQQGRPVQHGEVLAWLKCPEAA